MRNRSRRSWLAGGAVVLACAASAACVSTLKYDQLQQERDALQAKNEALKNEVDKSTKEGESLAQQKTALESQNSELQSKLQNSQSKGSELDTKLKDSEEEKKKLQDTYDGLVKDLKKELKAGQIEVTQLRDGLRVNVSQDILFDSGSAALDKNGSIVLTKVATQLKKSGHQIVVIGHTDNKPIRTNLAKQYPSNWELAGARAASVVRLFAKQGLQSKRMQAVSLADTQPAASNDTEQGRAKNRRIEIRLRPITPEERNS
jgi:chemotaxis protein MotB